MILSKSGQFRARVLELLMDTEASAKLVPELSVLVREEATDRSTRKSVGAVLIATRNFNPADEFDTLLAEGSATSLEILARWVTKRGVSSMGHAKVADLLEKLTCFYGTSRRRHSDGTSRDFIDLLIQSFTLAEVTAFLDKLSARFICTCTPQYTYACRCRYAKSKILGRLLDRYFALVEAGPHDAARIGQWIRALRFRGNVSTERSASVKHLVADDELRRTLQRRAVDELSGRHAHEAVIDLTSGHTHAGL